MKKTAIMIFAMLCSFIYAEAATLQEAAEAYGAQKYDDAAAMYEEIIAGQGKSSEVYYNLGNAYYKLKQYPKAILNYERALLMAPGDEDIRFNLELARTKITDKIDVIDRSFLSVWGDTLRNLFSSDTWSIIAIATFILFIAGAFLYFFTTTVWMRKLGFFGGFLLLVISVAANFFASKQKEKLLNRNEAIVISPSVTVKSSPADSGTDLFILHEGTKVKITDKVGEWSEIRIEDGNTGWMQNSKMEII